jgi:hypothetical protein
VREVHAHFEEVGAVAGHVPVVLREQQEGRLADFSPALRVDFGADELALRGVEFVVRVGGYGGGEVADEDVPVDDQLEVSLRADLVVPEDLVIVHQ